MEKGIATFVGQKIRELREAQHLSQVQLAERLKVAPNTVSRWETGANKPRINDLELVARELKRPIWAFFPPELQPDLSPTEAQRALLSATGDLPREDLEELRRFAEFIRARKVYPKQ